VKIVLFVLCVHCVLFNCTQLHTNAHEFEGFDLLSVKEKRKGDPGISLKEKLFSKGCIYELAEFLIGEKDTYKEAESFARMGPSERNR
jgi:hypothetical protein